MKKLKRILATILALGAITVGGLAGSVSSASASGVYGVYINSGAFSGKHLFSAACDEHIQGVDKVMWCQPGNATRTREVFWTGLIYPAAPGWFLPGYRIINDAGVVDGDFPANGYYTHTPDNLFAISAFHTPQGGQICTYPLAAPAYYTICADTLGNLIGG